MRYLKTNTATTITVGPFLDKTDGITPETGITVTGIHITLMVDNAGSPTLAVDADATASGGNNDMAHITNDDAGYYSLELTAANLNYIGGALLSLNVVGTACPVFHEFTILPAQVYDSLVAGTDLLDANAYQLGGTNQTGRDIGASVLLSSGTGTGQLDFTSGVVKSSLVQILGTALTETAGQIAAAFKQFFDVGSPTGTMKAITNVVTATNLTNAPTSGDFTATMKTSIGTAVAASAVASVTGDVGGNVAGSVGSVTGLTASDVGAIKLKTDKLTFDADNCADVNVQKINDVTLIGDGTTTPMHG